MKAQLWAVRIWLAVLGWVVLPYLILFESGGVPVLVVAVKTTLVAGVLCALDELVKLLITWVKT